MVSLSTSVAPTRSGKAVRIASQTCTTLADQSNEPGLVSVIIGFEYPMMGGKTVDVAKATWTNTIGVPEFSPVCFRP